MFNTTWDSKEKSFLGRCLDEFVLDHEFLQTIRDDGEEDLSSRVCDCNWAEFLWFIQYLRLL